MKRVIVALLLVTGAGLASATVGSIIGSFLLPSEPRVEIPLAIYRDPVWVYAVYYFYPGQELRRYTAAGSLVSSVPLPTTQGFSDACHCHLGLSYFGLVNSSEKRLYFLDKTTGAAAASFTVEGPAGHSPATVFWDGGKYFVGGRNKLFNMYTPAGSLIGSWEAAGWPSTMYTNAASAFSRSALNRRGRFLIASTATVGQPSCVIDMDTGSLVATWPKSFPNYNVAVCGDAYPSSFGASLWELYYNWGADIYWCYQTDVDARGATNVLPASVGKIKAIYR